MAQKGPTKKPENAMTAATQICPLHPHKQTYKRGSEDRFKKNIPTQHSTNKSCASLATRTSGGNISLMILVIVAAWQSQSSQVNPRIDFILLNEHIKIPVVRQSSCPNRQI